MASGTPEVRIGLAGWSEAVSRYRRNFPAEGTGLARYAGTFDFVEVNVTFYRAVREATLAGWAEQTPPEFRFSIKINRAITHAARLSAQARLDDALLPVRALGDKAGALLVQLPPSLDFDPEKVKSFLARLRSAYSGMVAWEPRHPGWDVAGADQLLSTHEVTRALTEIPNAATPHQASGCYVRLHGTPRRYRSSYSDADLAALAAWLAEESGPSFVVFDNTAGPAGVANALTLKSLV